MEKFTVTQIERISELNGDAALNEQEFETAKERDLAFREIEKKLSRQARQEIKELLDEKHMTDSVATGHKLEEWLQGEEETISEATVVEATYDEELEDGEIEE